MIGEIIGKRQCREKGPRISADSVISVDRAGKILSVRNVMNFFTFCVRSALPITRKPLNPKNIGNKAERSGGTGKDGSVSA